MCGIWDRQSTIVKDLNDSQDPKPTLFCRENAYVAIFPLFFIGGLPYSHWFLLLRTSSIHPNNPPSKHSPLTKVTALLVLSMSHYLIMRLIAEKYPNFYEL